MKKNKSKSPFKKAIEENLKILNKMKQEYLQIEEKKKILQDELTQNGYNSLEEKLEEMKFKKTE